jgi:hypothetical protein
MWKEEVEVEAVEVLHTNMTQIGVMKKSWPWLVGSKRNRLHWSKSSIHMLTWFLHYSNGTNYQMNCKQSHTPRLQELEKCAKTNGTISMVILSTF